MRRWLGFIALSIVGLFSGLAVADYTVKDASSATQTVFAFVCFTTKICPAHVLVTSAGVEILPSTAANQATEITSLASIAASAATTATNTGAPIPLGSNVIGFTSNDPCQTLTKTYTPINISASGSAKIITGTSAKKTYICQINLVTNAANNVALTEGTVTNCGTGTAGVIGGTTAASGWNFSANGGISLGMGGYAVLQSATNADDVCLNPSASTQLSGGVYWVQQ